MYLDFYNLRKNPFHITPDPEFFFLSSTHREAWASIIYGVKQRKGFIAVTGEVGVGKTTVLRSYLEGMQQSHLNTIYVFNSNISFRDLIKLILRELSITDAGDDIPAMVERLHLALIDEYRQDRSVILVIDEAQNMPVDTLENLRMLSNLETSKDKLIQIILVGQPEFERILGRHELRQLTQRIAIRNEIKPLTRGESLDYIAHRLKKSGQESTAIFSKAALNRIVKQARGIPRVINILCDNALITGYGYQKKPVTRRIVGEVLSDLKINNHGHALRWSLLPVAISVIALLSYIVTAYPACRKQISRLKQAVFNSAQFIRDENHAAPSTDSHSADGGGSAFRNLESGQEKVQASLPSAVKIIKVVPAPVTPANDPLSERTDETAKESAPVVSGSGVVDERSGAPAKLPGDAKPEHFSIPRTHDEEGRHEPPPSAAADETSLTGEAKESEAPPELYPGKRTVTKGENLTKLILETYGYVNDEILRQVRQKNPHIKNINILHAGDEIHFPGLSGDHVSTRFE